MSLAAKLIALSGQTRVDFVGATTRSDAGALSWPSGVAEGDFAVIASTYNSPLQSLSTSGWTSASRNSGSTYLNIWYKQLTAGDVSSPPSIDVTLGYTHVLVYRGPTGASIVSDSTVGTGTTLTLTGFNKASGFGGVLNVVAERDANAGSPPSGFTERSRNSLTSFFSIATADRLLPKIYSNGTSMVWTGFSASGAQVGVALELTRF